LERLVAAVDEPNERSHRLMLRCRFSGIGRGPGPKHKLVFYERRLSDRA
jgi:RimJ/RimL family protein N-acetyltransferase